MNLSEYDKMQCKCSPPAGALAVLVEPTNDF